MKIVIESTDFIATVGGKRNRVWSGKIVGGGRCLVFLIGIRPDRWCDVEAVNRVMLAKHYPPERKSPRKRSRARRMS